MKINKYFILLILIITQKAYSEINFDQLDLSLRKYSIKIQNQACRPDLPYQLDTNGLDDIDAALNTPQFLNDICIRSLHYKDCIQGPFSIANELIGLKNGVVIYNRDHTPDINYMICSTSVEVLWYSEYYPDQNDNY